MANNLFQIQQIEESIIKENFSEAKKILRSIKNKNSALQNLLELELLVKEGMSKKRISEKRLNQIFDIKNNVNDVLKLKNNNTINYEMNNLIADYYYNFNQFGKSFFYFREALNLNEGDEHAKIGISNSLQNLGCTDEAIKIMKNFAENKIRNFQIKYDEIVEPANFSSERGLNSQNLSLLPEYFLFSLGILYLKINKDISKRIFSTIKENAHNNDDENMSKITKVIVSKNAEIDEEFDDNNFYKRTLHAKDSSQKIFLHFIMPKNYQYSLKNISEFYLNMIDSKLWDSTKNLEIFKIKILNENSIDITSEDIFENWLLISNNFFGWIQKQLWNKEYLEDSQKLEKLEEILISNNMMFYGINSDSFNIIKVNKNIYNPTKLNKIFKNFMDYAEIFNESELNKEGKFLELTEINDSINTKRLKQFLDQIKNFLEIINAAEDENFQKKPQVKKIITELNRLQIKIQK